MIYGASVSKDTISRITDKVIAEMAEWSARPLEKVYAAVFIDAIHIKVRDGQVGNRPVYAAIGVDLAGHKDVLGLWAGTGGGETAKFWMSVLAELKNRGVADVFFVVCDAPVGAAGLRRGRLPAGGGADVCDPSDSQHLPVCLEEVLGPDRRGPQADLRGTDPGRGVGVV